MHRVAVVVPLSSSRQKNNDVPMIGQNTMGVSTLFSGTYNNSSIVNIHSNNLHNHNHTGNHGIGQNSVQDHPDKSLQVRLLDFIQHIHPCFDLE